jgi:lysozyme
MHVSHKGIEFIKAWEKLALTAYRDQAGHLTIGYGHRIRQGEDLTTITPAQAWGLLLTDLEPAEDVIHRRVTVPLAQHQYDALASFVFNAGAAAFAGSTLLSRLNASDYRAAAQEFRRWVYVTDPATREKRKSKGLIARRAAEERLFEAGIY